MEEEEKRPRLFQYRNIFFLSIFHSRICRCEDRGLTVFSLYSKFQDVVLLCFVLVRASQHRPAFESLYS